MTSQYSTSPIALVASLIARKGLVWELVKREFYGRYKGSFLGMAWSLFNPLLMLLTYTFVFSVALKIRWGSVEYGNLSFATVLFSGMIVHGLFAECLNSAPTLIVRQPNYVKKVVFPLEVLPWVLVCSALLHFLVNLGLLLMFCVLSGAKIHLSVLLVPIVMLPLVLTTLGLTWLFASLGVYVRDISQGMGLVTTVLLFLSPVFYPLDALPKEYQSLLAANPLSIPIEQLRSVVLSGRSIDWTDWVVSVAVGTAIAYAGFWWFQKSRRGFADVL